MPDIDTNEKRQTNETIFAVFKVTNYIAARERLYDCVAKTILTSEYLVSALILAFPNKLKCLQ